ncbi:hypothetical protein KYK29_06590 [Shinella daejeonensis]|nr:hypothetical protein [Shinella daejeonensis]MCP8894595.1 hypothetical protein [Shinella daejeonensis]
MSAATATVRLEVFRTGTFTPMEGEPITYSAADRLEFQQRGCPHVRVQSR